VPATISWLAAFTVCPDPGGPTRTTVEPTVSKIDFTASKSSGSPPTMIDSLASFAPASPPLTGASSTRTPASRPASDRRTATSGRIVDMSTCRAPRGAFA
jgi:hypothetical protein